MTVQLPLILWTIICFVLFALIIYNLLFKPVLEVMDKRRARIEDAEKKKQNDADLLEEAARIRQENLEKAVRFAQKQESLKEKQAAKASVKSIELMKEKCSDKISSYQEKTKLDKAEYQTALADGVAGIASDFVSGFTD